LYIVAANLTVLALLAACLWAQTVLPDAVDVHWHDTHWVTASPLALLVACTAAAVVNAIIVFTRRIVARSALFLSAAHLVAMLILAALIVLAARAVRYQPSLYDILSDPESVRSHRSAVEVALKFLAIAPVLILIVQVVFGAVATVAFRVRRR